ncbi:cysteine--tRNA ligase [bacterium]|nr:cysteine--tRNA ligase [bacterium]
MTIYFHNTLSKMKEEFVPINSNEVRMYTCGPTVYDFAHIGNYRAYLFEDLLRRVLQYNGYKVTQVMNLTDVDDKTIKGSQELGIPLDDFTRKFKDEFFKDLDTLRIQRAEYYPEATKHIPQMVDLVKRLIENEHAYLGEDNCYYYRVSSFEDYGKLSGKKINELICGIRVRSDDYSKDEARDFALWKSWAEEDGPVFWETDLGKGRPGWHIECSAMSTHYLGNHFDIHTGGEDNIFPHHENEIAQSEGATGEKFVNYWLHCAHLIVNGEKMSKSLGNFYTLRDLLEKGYDPVFIRLLLLSTYYRQQLNFSFEGLEATKESLNRLYDFIEWLKRVKEGEITEAVNSLVNESRRKFKESLNNDLNISPAIASIYELIKNVYSLNKEKAVTSSDAEALLNFVHEVNTILDILPEDKGDLEPELMQLITEREDARVNKDWNRADRIRDELAEKGIILEDTPDGTIWKKRG